MTFFARFVEMKCRGSFRRILFGVVLGAIVLALVGCGGNVDQARSYLDDGKSKGALELLEPYVDNNPGESAAWEQLGRAYFQEGQFESASYAYQLSQQLKSSVDPTLGYRIGQSEYRAGNYQSALQAFHRVEDSYPDQAKFYVQLGEVKESLGFREDAKKHYSRALSSDSDNIQALSNTAEMALEEGDVDRTREYLNRALEVDTGDSRPRIIQARLALAEGESTRTLGVLEPVVKKWPVDPQVNLLMARAYDSEGAPRRAAEHYRTALSSRFESSSIHDEFGQFLMQTGNDTGALDHLNWALRMNQDNVQAYYDRAVLYDRNGNTSAAIRDYRAVLERNQNHVRALNNLGVIFLQENRPDEALSLLNQALDVQPSYQLARINQARALWIQGEEESARDLLEAVLETVSEDNPAYEQAQSLLEEWS